MIYLGFPVGCDYGWGVLGKYVVLAMAEFADVGLVPQPDENPRIHDEFEAFLLRRLLALPRQHGTKVRNAWQMNGPVIQIALGPLLEPFMPQLAPPASVAYAVFEENLLPMSAIAQSRCQYRHVAVASSYCANVLRQYGLTEVSVIPHGVDTALFRPRREPRPYFKDRFIVFSGGKFELRKGQDIVIRAYKVLQDRHPDVMLVNCWFNKWPQCRDTMAESKLIRYVPLADDNYWAWVNKLLADNGIDTERVITVYPRNNRMLPDPYHSTDLGLFPNRVEGGNNMVLMEYLACGKPAIASYNSGHIDILHHDNAVLIEEHRPLERRNIHNKVISIWSDPSLEETIEKLEWCYQHRNELQPRTRRAAADMRQFTWRRVAEELFNAVARVEQARCEPLHAEPAQAVP